MDDAIFLFPVERITREQKDVPFDPLIYHDGLAVRMATGESLQLAKEGVLDMLWNAHVCSGIKESYIIESLAVATHIFMVLTKIRGNQQVNPFALPGGYVPLAFVVCSRNDNQEIKVDLELLCARDLPVIQRKERSEEAEPSNKLSKKHVLLQVGVGVVLMACVIRYFKAQGEDMYLHALTNDLVTYYARLGFVLAHKNKGCAFIATPGYIDRFYRSVQWQSNLIAQRKLDPAFEKPYTENEYMEMWYYHQLGKARPRPLNENSLPNETNNRRHFFAEQGLGLYMILCTGRVELVAKADDFVAKYQIVPAAYWTDYQVEFNPDARQRAVQMLEAEKRKQKGDK